MIIRKRSYPRAGLIGNPSDGFYGQTIAFVFSNYHAEVVLYETPELEILPNIRDHSLFRSIDHLVEDVHLFGYYGGIRLLKAAIKRFYGYAGRHGIELHDRNFTIRYHSDIPHLVGLAGSSAIITACMRALMAFYGVTIPKPELANLILAVETEELQISAGLQDRVAQTYEGLVYMDFDKEHMEREGFGRYESLDLSLLPDLYIAFRRDLSQGSEFVHKDLRHRYERRDPEVLDAMGYWAGLTSTVREKLLAGNGAAIGEDLNANFDRRCDVCQISEGNIRMVEAARSTGATAKFTGSGGAIVGTLRDEAMFTELKRTLEPLDVEVLRPTYVPAGQEGEV